MAVAESVAAEIESDAVADPLMKAVEWLSERKFAHEITVIGYSWANRRPFVFVSSLVKFRELFKGQKAAVKRDSNSEEWRVTVDGIDFECRQYLGSGAGETREEVL